MKLIEFHLQSERSWEPSSPLSGLAKFTLDSGTELSLKLSPIQVELIAKSIAEMLIYHTKKTGEELKVGKIQITPCDNLLEN